MKRSKSLLAGLVALFLPSAAVAGDDHAFAAVVAAERAFAADAGRIGINAAFRAHAAPDAILFQPGPVPAAPLLTGDSAQGVTLEWAPSDAIVAASGDLAASTGPARLRSGGRTRIGRFLTIWRRDQNDRWRWAIDFGLPPRAGELAGFPLEVRRLHTAQRAVPGRSIEATDDRANRDWTGNRPGLLRARMYRNALLLRDQGATTPEPVASEARRLGSLTSRARDLAISYGEARAADGQRGHYLRVWRHAKGRWRIVIDQTSWSPAA